MSRQFGHDGFGGVVGGLPDVLDRVSEAEEEVGQDVDDVGLEQATQHVAQHLESQQRPLAVGGVLETRVYFWAPC